MATTYPVKMSISLKTDQADRPIPVRIGIDQNIAPIMIHGSTTINFEFDAHTSATITVEVFDKQGQEAVIVESMSFFGIDDPRFVWAGVYSPVYPEPWHTEQKQQGKLWEAQLAGHTYLSWPGKWQLTFDVPVFTWIHKIQNLGWIYS